MSQTNKSKSCMAKRAYIADELQTSTSDQDEFNLSCDRVSDQNEQFSPNSPNAMHTGKRLANFASDDEMDIGKKRIALTTEMLRLKQENDLFRTQKTQNDTGANDLERENICLRRDLEAQKQSYHKIEEVYNRSQDCLIELNEYVNAIVDKFNKLEETRTQQEKGLLQSKATLEDLIKSATLTTEELIICEEKLKKERETNAEMCSNKKSNLMKCQQLTKKVADLTSQLDAAVNQKLKLNEELETKQIALNERDKKMEDITKTNNALTKEIEKLPDFQQKIKIFENTLTLYEEKYMNNEKEGNEKLVHLEKTIKDLENDQCRLKSQLQSVVKEKEILQYKHDQTLKLNKDLSGKIEDQEKTIFRLELKSEKSYSFEKLSKKPISPIVRLPLFTFHPPCKVFTSTPVSSQQVSQKRSPKKRLPLKDTPSVKGKNCSETIEDTSDDDDNCSNLSFLTEPVTVTTKPSQSK